MIMKRNRCLKRNIQCQILVSLQSMFTSINLIRKDLTIVINLPQSAIYITAELSIHKTLQKYDYSFDTR